MYPYFSRLQGKIEATTRFGKGIPMPTYYYSDYCRQICIKIFPVTCVTRIIQFIGCCAVCFSIFPFISVFIFFLSIYLCVIYLSIYPSIQLPIDIKCSRFITWICGLAFIDRFHVIFVFIILYQIFTIDNITHIHIYIYLFIHACFILIKNFPGMDGPRLQPRPVLVAQAAHGPGENHPKRSPWNWTMRGKWWEWGFPEMVPSSPIAGSYEKKRWFRGTPILRNLQMRENGSVNMFFTAQKKGMIWFYTWYSKVRKWCYGYNYNPIPNGCHRP